MKSSARYTFLLLEDDPRDAELEEQWLRNAGLDFDLTVVDTRERFETAFHQNPYDLILSDYSLPDFDGHSALRIVRAKYGRLPFIYVSGVLGEEVAVDTMRDGATDYILKNRLDRLGPAVQRALSEHEDFLRGEKAEAKLRQAEALTLANAHRQGLLLNILQEQRVSTNPETLMTSTAHQVAKYLGVSQAGFYELLDDGSLHLGWHYIAGEGQREDNLRSENFDKLRHESFRRGELAIVPDILSMENPDTVALRELDIRSFVAVPIFHAEIWRAGFWVANHEPREWTREETLFIREIAEVTWDSVERARAVAKLEASEQRLRTAAETANLGSWDLDMTTGKMLCSDQCKKNYGWPLESEFNYPDLRDSIHPDDRDFMAAAVEKAIADHGTYRAEYRNIWPDGSLHWVIAAGRAHYNESGVPKRMTGFTLDVTERHKSQAALLQSEKLAAVGRLASSIAHEINNPLEAVTNLLYLAAGSSDLPMIREYLDSADQELRRVAAITAQTLRFHRQSGEPKAVTSKDLFDSVLMIFQRRLSNCQIEVSTRLKSQQPIRCLDGEIRQVLNNLVSNAIDAMHSGGCLAIRSRDGTHENVPGVWLSVADTGQGIVQKVQERLFEAFFTTKGINGTGLGLWVSQEIVARHKGVLRFRSSQSSTRHGTIFSLFLPYSGMG